MGNSVKIKSNEVRGRTKTVKCACCKEPFEARVADIKRGWGKYCSKSCKAIRQEQRTGQYGRVRGNSSPRRGRGGNPPHPGFVGSWIDEDYGPMFNNAHHFDNTENGSD